MVNPFDAPAGTVWVHEDRDGKDTLYVVLPYYTSDVPGQHPMWSYRYYLNLETGEVTWFMQNSHFCNDSKRFM